MTAETDLVLLGDRHMTVGAEGSDRRLGFAPAYALRVAPSRAMATFALELREGAIRIAAERMTCVEDRQYRKLGTLVVAGKTGVRTTRTQRSWLSGVSLLTVYPRCHQ